MRNYLLLIIAILIRTLIEFVLIARGIYKWGDSFAFNVAKDIDREGETLFWNTGTTATISAMVYHKEKWWAIKTIDWLFQDKDHCRNAWLDEFDLEVK